MNTLFIFSIGIVYAFFGLIVVFALHYMDSDSDNIAFMIWILWPVVLIIALICFAAYCGVLRYRIGKPIGEWLHKKLFEDQRED